VPELSRQRNCGRWVREFLDKNPCALCAHQLKCFQSKTCQALILLVPSPAPIGTLKLSRMRNISYIVSGPSGVFRVLPVDGYVTNLNLRLGSQAVANQPALALVDVNSFRVQGFFQETSIRNIRAGDRAIMTRWPIRVHPSKVASAASTGGSLTRTATRVTSCYPRLSRPSSEFGSPSACPRSCGPGLRYFPSEPLNPQPKTVENVRANSSSINIILFMAVSSDNDYKVVLVNCSDTCPRSVSLASGTIFPRNHLLLLAPLMVLGPERSTHNVMLSTWRHGGSGTSVVHYRDAPERDFAVPPGR
jgi:hypothetical protein